MNGVLLMPEVPNNILAATKLSKNTGIEILFKEGRVHMKRDNTYLETVTIKGGLPYFSPVEDTQLSLNTHKGTEGEATHPTDNAEHKLDLEGAAQGLTPSDSPQHSESDEKKLSVGKPIHDTCAHLLHRKLGHVSFPAIQIMLNCTKGLKLKNCENYLECSVCKCSKLKSKPRPRKATCTTNSIFQLVHMDLVGPLKPSITYRKRFFLTIVDDYSRYGFVYTIRHKNEIFQKFKEFYKRVKTQNNTKIKQIMTDRGSEFMLRDFSS